MPTGKYTQIFRLSNVNERRTGDYFKKDVIDFESVLYALRMKYLEEKDVFLEKNIKVKEPISLFKEWLENALKTEELLEPNSACIATVNKNGIPSNRFVLVKDVTPDGFTFFTNYGSRKARDIEQNPNVALTFYWCPLMRSVRVEGVAEKISKEDSLTYFHQRPRASQIGALASPQSKIIKNRDDLDAVEAKLKAELESKQVPLPNWGGYLIRPRLVEFWQGQTNRMHDRIRFRKDYKPEDEDIDEALVNAGENGWVYERLAP